MTTTKLSIDEYDVRTATLAEGREMFDRRCRELLGISGAEFLRRWDNGEYDESGDPNINTLAVLIPFAR